MSDQKDGGAGAASQFMRNISNEDDPDYDEDAAMCRCGHSFRQHCGRAFGYACAVTDCACNEFLPSSP